MSSSPGWSRLPPWGSPALLERWFEVTSWWLSTGASTWNPRRLLADLLEGIAGQFTGQHIQLEIHGNPVELTLQGLAVETTAPEVAPAPFEDLFPPWLPRSPYQAVWRVMNEVQASFVPRELGPGRVRLDASDMRIAGEYLDNLTALIDDVRIEPGLLPSLVTGQLDLVVKTTRNTVLAFIRRAQPEWDIRDHRGGTLLVRQAGRRYGLVVKPVIAGSAVDVIVQRIVVFGRELPLPRRFLVRRTVHIPQVAPRLDLVDAAETEDQVIVRLRHPGVKEALPLDTVRDLIRSGVARWAI